MCPGNQSNLPTEAIILHRLTMGDVEDPYVTAAFPISQWQETEKGRWVMEHVLEPPTFHCSYNPNYIQTNITITGKLSEQDKLIFYLKWGISK